MRVGLHSENIEKTHILFALDLPGCYAEGATEAEGLGNFPAAFASYGDWLLAHGEAIPDLPDPPEAFAIVGRFASYTLADGYEVNGLFAPEWRPAAPAFVARCHRLLGYARVDLLAAARAIPTSRWDTAFGPGERTPRQVIEHVARAERWYLSHFAGVPRALLDDHPPGSPSQFGPSTPRSLTGSTTSLVGSSELSPSTVQRSGACASCSDEPSGTSAPTPLSSRASPGTDLTDA
jgi:predicted RNase H-like HicB family nuclease